MKHVICNHCGTPFRWDEVSTGDECPICHNYVRGSTNQTTLPAWEGHYRNYLSCRAGCVTRDTSTEKYYVQYMVFCYNNILKSERR